MRGMRCIHLSGEALLAVLGFSEFLHPGWDFGCRPTDIRNPAFRARRGAGTVGSHCAFAPRIQVTQAGAPPNLLRSPTSNRSLRRGRRSFATYYQWVDDALRHRADGYRLLDSALVGLPGVRRLARQRFRRSAFADVHATRALLQQATGRLGDPDPAAGLGAAALLRRPADVRHRGSVGPAQPPARLGRLPAASGVEAVTREFLALALGEFRSK